MCLKRFGSDASVISKEDSQGVLSSRQHVTSGGEHVCAFGFALSQNDCPSSGTLQAQGEVKAEASAMEPRLPDTTISLLTTSFNPKLNFEITSKL